MKKQLLNLIIITSVLLIGCGKVDPVADKIMNDINAIGEVTLDDEELISNSLEIYATLTEKQKEQVENYIVLLEAKNKLDELKKQTESLVEEIYTQPINNDFSVQSAVIEDYKFKFAQDFPITVTSKNSSGTNSVRINEFSYTVSALGDMLTVNYKLDYDVLSSDGLLDYFNYVINIYDENGNFVNNSLNILNKNMKSESGLMVIPNGIQEYTLEFGAR